MLHDIVVSPCDHFLLPSQLLVVSAVVYVDVVYPNVYVYVVYVVVLLIMNVKDGDEERQIKMGMGMAGMTCWVSFLSVLMLQFERWEMMSTVSAVQPQQSQLVLSRVVYHPLVIFQFVSCHEIVVYVMYYSDSL